MAEAVRAWRTEAVGLLDRRSLGDALDYALPVVMATLFVLSLVLTLQRGVVLASWSEDYGGSGGFLVESCQARSGLGADQWVCAGRLSADGLASDRPSTLITSLGAMASDRPYVGEQIDVFFEPEDRSEVFPLEYRLNEMTRLYLSLLPRLLLMIGSGFWLAGWFFTRKLNADDLVTRDSVRMPQRFLWRSRGLTWIGVALLVVVGNYLLATMVIGSLGIA